MPTEADERKLPRTREEWQKELDQFLDQKINQLAKEKGVDPILIRIHIFDFLHNRDVKKQ